MLTQGAHSYLLYDGDCGVCSKLAGWAQKIDKKQQFKIQPYQIYSAQELAQVGLSPALCAYRLQLITSTGKIYSGAFAVNQFLWVSKVWAFVVVLIYAIPPLLLAEVVGYAIFARYRHRISRWLGLNECLITHRDASIEAEQYPS